MKFGGALQTAIDNDDADAVDAAVASGEEVSQTAVSHASTSNKVKALQALLEHVDEVGASALILAAQNGRFEALKCLVDSGVDPDIGDASGVTALMYAAMKNRPAFLELLLDSGADVNHQDSQGRAAVDLAIKYESKDAAQTLLDRGAQLSEDQSAQLAKMGLDVEAEAAGVDESRLDEVLGRWSPETVRYEGDFEAAGFSPDRSDTMSSAELGIEDNFVEFAEGGEASGRYFHSDFAAEWELDGDRLTVTTTLHDPVTYRLSSDGSSLERSDFDEEHGLDMYVTFTRAD